MYIVHVDIHVKPESREEFIQATLVNARQSLQESGIARFDFIQYIDDANHFLLIEVYRDDLAPGQHKETLHYQRWRDTVAEMMAEPRTSVKYLNLYPEDDGWG